MLELHIRDSVISLYYIPVRVWQKKKEAGGYFPKGDCLKKIGGPSLVFGYAPKINKK